MTEQEVAARHRPAGVSFVVALTWLVAVVDLIGGIALFLISFNRTAFDREAVDPALLRSFALIAIVVGLLTLLVAIGLATGSQFSRVLTVTIMVLRLANALWALFAVGNFLTWGLIAEAALAILIIALLTNRAASDYFRGRVTPPAPPRTDEQP